MKKSIYFGVMMIALVAFTFTSCNKYEEGSNFSLLTAKSRVVNDWKSTSVTINGTEMQTNWWYEASLKKDGTGTFATVNSSGSTTENIKWAFDSDKENLLITDSNNSTETYEIVMLKKNDLKLRQVNTILGSEVTSILVFTTK